LIVPCEGSISQVSSPRFCTEVGIFDTNVGNNGASLMIETVWLVRKGGFYEEFINGVKPPRRLSVVAI